MLNFLRATFVTALAGVVLVASAQAAHLAKVHILATGGTIAGSQPDTGDTYYRPALSAEDLVRSVPGLGELADIRTEQIANIGSENMSHEIWFRLAARIETLLAGGEADGVVVTHGTDTLEETAYFLSLVVHSDKPVILVGAMRPASANGADGPANLYNAVALAAHPRAGGRGPLVVINDQIHYAREVTKTNTLRPDAFDSPNRGPAGLIHAGSARFFNTNDSRHTRHSEFSLEGLNVQELPDVAIVYSHAGYGDGVIRHLIDTGVDGIVLAGVGAGNTTDAARAALSEAVSQGVAVVRSSRVGSGIVERSSSPDDPMSDARLGFIAAQELNPQKARILLMLGLTRTRDTKALQRLFNEY